MLPCKTREISMIVLLAVVLALSIPDAGAQAGSAEKPNIVLILMDNFGWGEIGVYGGGVMRGST